MKRLVLAATLAAALGLPATQASAQNAAGTSLGSVTLSRAVMAAGQKLAAGTYQVRLTNESPKPGIGQSPEGERYVELLRSGKVVAREVAVVVPQAEIGNVAKGPRPATNGSRVDVLKGDDYVRVWINRGGNNYLLHLSAATS